jgi:hypothetical protein
VQRSRIVELYLHSPIHPHGVVLINYAQGNVYYYFDKLHGVISQKRVIFNAPALAPPNKLASLLVILIDIGLTSVHPRNLAAGLKYLSTLKS